MNRAPIDPGPHWWRSWFHPEVWLGGDESGSTPTLRLLGHATVDEIVLAAFRSSGDDRSDEEIDEVSARAEEALALYRQLGWVADPSRAFTVPSAPEAERVETKRARTGRFRYVRIRFPSDYRPHPDDPVAEPWSAFDRNQMVHAWIMRHDEPRPWVVCLHGTGMGRALADFGLFRANWLHERLGLNVAVPVLPFHGPRRPRSGQPSVRYPGPDVLTNFHATLQAASDVRRTLAWIRSHDDQPIAVHGVSLGGYVAAVVASLEPRLDCVLLGAPVANLTALLEAHMVRTASDRQLASLEVGRELSAIVSPLSLRLAVPVERTFIYAGVADRMVPHRDHARKLWSHWGEPRALWFDGGHAGLGISREVGSLIASSLAGSGVSVSSGERP